MKTLRRDSLLAQESLSPEHPPGMPGPAGRGPVERISDHPGTGPQAASGCRRRGGPGSVVPEMEDQ